MSAIIQKYLFRIVVLAAASLFAACNPTAHLQPDQYLLRGDVKVKGNNSLSGSNIRAAVRTRPNRKFLVSKIYLHSYNFGLSLEKDSSFVKRIVVKNSGRKEIFDKAVNFFKEKLGEPPVLLDSAEIQRDSVNLRNAYFAKGYFFPEILWEIDTVKDKYYNRQANVVFRVKQNVPFLIGFIDDSIESPAVAQIYQQSLEKRNLKAGDNYDHKAIGQERQRITELMRNNGFFTFSQKLVSFTVDTFWKAPAVPPDQKAPQARFLRMTVKIEGEPIRFKVRQIILTVRGNSDKEDALYAEFRAHEITDEKKNALGIPENRLTDVYPMTWIVAQHLVKKLNYNYLSQRVHLFEGGYYSLADARKTQRRLQELGMFQFVVMNYDVVDSLGVVDVRLSLRMAPQYQVKAGMEAFSDVVGKTVNLPSIGANLAFRNRNTFRRSELLQLSVAGVVGWYAASQDTSQQLFNEFLAKADINFPRFLLPSKISRRFQGNNPITTFTASERWENRQEYIRSTTGLNLTYKWNHVPYQVNEFSQLTPMALDLIFVPSIDSAFQSIIDMQPEAIRREYESRFSSRIRWIYTNSQYRATRIKPTHYFRSIIEVGGNLPFLLDYIGTVIGIGEDISTKDNLLFNQLYYGQYVKASVEGRYFIPLWPKGELVVRMLMGGALGYNQTKIVPPESRFFSGGTNSMRGWQSNTLGPGRLSLDSLDSGVANLLAPGGEWILEMNAELRFDLLSYLELAFFTDLGNVWFNDNEVTRTEIGPEAVLSGPNFRLGWDAGVGFRFDFSFLILRVDLGQQIYAPDKGWVFRNITRKSGVRTTQLNLGLGYPF